MIQPNFPYAHSSVYPPNGDTQQQVVSADSLDEAAYQRWLSRRDAARLQIRRLSRRELQVVNLVAHGLANKSIAQELEISVKTIEKHRANAARKLGVNNTAELVRLSVLADQDLMINKDRPRAEIAFPQSMHSLAGGEPQ